MNLDTSSDLTRIERIVVKRDQLLADHPILAKESLFVTCRRIRKNLTALRATAEDTERADFRQDCLERIAAFALIALGASEPPRNNL
jgi:hypothetical protein